MADLDKAFKAFAKELKQVIKAATGEGGDPSKLPTLDSVGEIGEVSSEETKKKIAYMAELTATQVQYNNILGDTAAAGEALLKLDKQKQLILEQINDATNDLDQETRESLEEQLVLMDAVLDANKDLLEDRKKMTQGMKDAEKASDAFWSKTLGFIGMTNKAQDTYVGKFTNFLSKFKTKGGPAEFFKSMGRSMSALPLSILDSIINMTIQYMMALDQAQSSFSKATGFGRKYHGVIMDVEASTRHLGIAAADIDKATQSFVNNLGGVSQMSNQAKGQLVGTIAKLNQIGVGFDAGAKAASLFTDGLGLSAMEASKTVEELAMMGEAINMSAKDMINGFQQASTQLAVYGKRMQVQIFGKLAAAAKAAGVEIGSLLKIAGGFDTFAGAAEQAGKLNAILGSNLSSTELLMMTEEQRIETVIKEIQMGGTRFQDMDRFKQKAIANALGITDMAEANKILGVSFGKYKQNQELMKKQAAAQKKVDKAIADSKSVRDNFTIFFSKFVSKHGPKFLQFLQDGLPRLLKFAETYGPMIVKGMLLVKGFLMIVQVGKAVYTVVAALKGITILQTVATKGAAAAQGAYNLVMGGFQKLGRGIKAFMVFMRGAKTVDVIQTGEQAAADTVHNVVKAKTTVANTAVGASSKKAALGMLAMGAAAAMIGGAIYLAATGLGNFVASFAGLDTPQLIAAGLGLIAFGIGLYFIATALAAFSATVAAGGAIGIAALVAIGVSVLMIGAGIGLAAAGISMIVTAMAKLLKVMMSNIKAFGAIALVAGVMAVAFYFAIPANVGLAASLTAVAGPATAAALPLLGIGAAAMFMGFGVMLAGAGIALVIESIASLAQHGLKGASAMLAFAMSVYILAGAVALLANPLSQLGMASTIALVTALAITATGMAAYMTQKVKYMEAMNQTMSIMGGVNLAGAAAAFEDIGRAIASIDDALGGGRRRVQIVSVLENLAVSSAGGAGNAAMTATASKISGFRGATGGGDKPVIMKGDIIVKSKLNEKLFTYKVEQAQLKLSQET